MNRRIDDEYETTIYDHNLIEFFFNISFFYRFISNLEENDQIDRESNSTNPFLNKTSQYRANNSEDFVVLPAVLVTGLLLTNFAQAFC
jgi:hypothetical protein